MRRDELIERLEEGLEWDVIVIGGGATGLGCAVDSAARGFKTLLLEAKDFASGTSSRSTKLIHGGLRYLQQGNISLVSEALKERGLLCKNAPHLISHLPFLVPNYQWWEGPFYGIGLKFYDLLAGKLGLEKSEHLSKEETTRRIPTIETNHLRGGVVYYDGQFDDSRLAMSLVQTAHDLGATPLNYMQVTELIKTEGRVKGVKVTDHERGDQYEVLGKVVINATGIFTDNIRKMDTPDVHNVIVPSQGVHLVLSKEFLKGETALLVPHTKDGRVVFVVPWHNHVMIGTTDTPVEGPSHEPTPLDSEIEFILESTEQYLKKPPQRSDVLSVFAGIRPLVSPSGDQNTASIARDHVILKSDSGLVTITGGKWTIYRKMGEDAIDKAIETANLKKVPCKTEELQLHGYLDGIDPHDRWATYGTDATLLRSLIEENREWERLLHPDLPYQAVEVIWAIRYEMARHLDDILSRRTRALLLNANAALEIAQSTAELMAEEMGKCEVWIAREVESFKELAKNYLPG